LDIAELIALVTDHLVTPLFAFTELSNAQKLWLELLRCSEDDFFAFPSDDVIIQYDGPTIDNIITGLLFAFDMLKSAKTKLCSQIPP
jgi:hypothetical protein